MEENMERNLEPNAGPDLPKSGKKGLVIMLVAFAVLILLASLLYGKLGDTVESQMLAQNPTQSVEGETAQTEGENNAGEAVGELAPDFTVYTQEGEAVKLSDLRGKPVVLNFWASWCGPCKSEMPTFNKVWAEQGEDVTFMMVNLTDNMQETVERASAYVAEEGFGFPVYYDTELDAARTYGVQSVPVTYFIDAEGKGVAYAMGALEAEILQKGIDMIAE